MRWLVLVVGLVGCAAPAIQPLTADAPRDLAFAPSDLASAPGDLASAPGDLARPQDLAAPPDLAPDDAGVVPGGACVPRINEVATGTTTSGLEEFVELYNPCSTAIPLAGYQLDYRAAAGKSDVVLVSDLKVTLAAGGFAVFAGGSYYSSARQGAMSSGLAEAGGGLALRGPTGEIVDSMGWGSATNDFVVGASAPAPQDKAAPGRSTARSPDGLATGSNATDFQVTDQPTPGAPNVIHCSGC